MLCLLVPHILHKDEYECYPAKQQSDSLGEELLDDSEDA